MITLLSVVLVLASLLMVVLVLLTLGNVLTRYDAYNTTAQRTTTFTYDALDRMISKTDANGAAVISSNDAYYVALRKQLSVHAVASATGRIIILLAALRIATRPFLADGS